MVAITTVTVTPGNLVKLLARSWMWHVMHSDRKASAEVEVERVPCALLTFRSQGSPTSSVSFDRTIDVP